MAELWERVARLEKVLEQHIAECDVFRDFWGEDEQSDHPERGAASPVVTEACIKEMPDTSSPGCCAVPGTAAEAAAGDDSTEALRRRLERLEQLITEHVQSCSLWNNARGDAAQPPKEAAADGDLNKIRLSEVYKDNEEPDADSDLNKIRLSGAPKSSREELDAFGPVLPAAVGASMEDLGPQAARQTPDAPGMMTSGLAELSATFRHLFTHKRTGSAGSASPASITHVDHALQESSWDALLLLGLPDIGTMGSMMVAFGVVSAAGLQLLFCWLVSSNLLSDDDKYDLTYLREWRIYYGHSVHSFDHTSGSSLVSKVCNGRPFEREWWNNALLSEVDAYLQPVIPGIKYLPIGVVLTSMAILIWFCFILLELDTVFGFMNAILRVPRTGATQVEFTEFGRRAFISISYKRLIALCFMSFIRAFIAVTLGASAGLWLARTRDVNDILRDGVSLIFILEIDDLIYKVLVPSHAKKYMASIQKFLVKEEQQMYLFNLASLLKLFVLCAEQAENVRDMICGGNRDFYDLKNAENMLPGSASLVEDVP
ncbi:unnamed protein product [Symbiodinium natans]|uniref:Uncharacterized protein n=1 Tax=Symbiodinium natans TaxID=878477 RepID=A0A812J9R3_9DINO|nr:unnamed protein product [Symbiodinium natans]